MKYAALILLATLQIVLSLILSYRKRSKNSQAFILIILAIATWTIANTLLDYYQRGGNFIMLSAVNKAGFFLGTLVLGLIYRITLHFPKELSVGLLARIALASGLIFPWLTLSPSISGVFSYDLNEYGEYTYEYGDWLLLIALYAFAMIAASARNVTVSLKSSLAPLLRKQAITVYGALLLSAFLAVMLMVILPAIHNRPRTWVMAGYYAPLIFTTTVFYSIFKQRFLEFRIVVARSVAYLLSTLLLGSAFAVLSFFVLNKLFFASEEITVAQGISYTVLALILTTLYLPTKKIFDKLSNKIFYRDAYDPQAFIAKLNSSVITVIDVGAMLTGSAELIKNTMSAEYCYFAVLDRSTSERRYYGDNISKEITKQMLALQNAFVNNKLNFAAVDGIDDTYGDLHNVMVSSSASVMSWLVSAEKDKQARIGFVVVGDKKSGNTYSSDDLQTLSIVFNQISIALQNALRFEEIENFNVTLQQKVDDATRELRRTNDKLKALDEAKNEFIGMASHQLRTPLTSIKGYVSMVLEGDAGTISASQRKMLDQAFVSSQRMVYLIADLLNVSRLQTGKFVIESKPTALACVVNDEVLQLKEAAKNRNINLTYHKPKDFPLLMLDETKMRQVVMNFIDNAVYYTPDGGEITVALEDKGSSVEYTVKDNGIGVPKNEQHHLFTKFYRAGNARKARPDGTGLGLFMAKKVIIAQGGALIFHSEEGKGSTFGFSFSKKKLQVPGDNAQVASHK